MKIPLVVIGASTMGDCAISIANSIGVFEVVALIDDSQPKGNNKDLYSGCIDSALNIIDEKTQFVVAIGNNAARKEVTSRVRAKIPNARFASLIHPAANLMKPVEIESGCIVFPGAVIAPNCHVGESCIINANVSIGANSKIASYCNIAPGSNIGSSCSIEDEVFIGMGVSLFQYLHVGSNSVIGAGSLVRKNIPSNSIAYGSPAACRET